MKPPAPDTVQARPGATLRPATTADIPAIRDLLTLRDRRAWDDASTRWFVHDLDPDRCLAWLAFVDQRPVGLTTMFLRRLRSPSGTHRAAYWANLFIDPAHRGQMLYPRLPMMMFATARSLGLDFIYGSVRLRDVALAHTRIGFAKIGSLSLLGKPLRPLRLIGKYKRWRPLPALSPPIDWLWAGFLGARRRSVPAGFRVEEVPVTSSTAEELVTMLGAAQHERIVDTWTPESFDYRYRRTREETRYFILAVRRGGALAGGIVYRNAEREPNIQVAVIMDVICGPGQERAMVAALAEAERRALAAGCELMMFLSGLGPAVDDAFRSFGYRSTRELYDMVVWPKQAIAACPLLGDPARWRFSFGDHDAF